MSLNRACRSGHGARVEQREQEFGVVDFELGEVVDLPDLMADGKAQVPQRMQDGAHASFFGGADPAVEEQQDVDVRVQAELPSSIPAERHDETGGGGISRIPDEILEKVIDAVRKALQRRASALASRGRG